MVKTVYVNEKDIENVLKQRTSNETEKKTREISNFKMAFNKLINNKIYHL